MQIETTRLWIRPFTMDDLADMHEYCAQPGIGINAGWPAHRTLGESEEILEEWISEGCRHAIVWKETGKVVGHIAVDPDSEEGRADTRELGCALNRFYHRRGIMTEAIRAVLRYLFETTEVTNAWACCFRENLASKGMIEKCGFAFMQEGTYESYSLDRVFDSYEYRITKAQWQALQPAECVSSV